MKDPTLPGMTKEERSAIYDAVLDVVCKIHDADIHKAGLEGYGKQGQRGSV